VTCGPPDTGGSPDPVTVLRSLPAGTRVVVRSRIPGGFTDAIGTLHDRTDLDCTLLTRTGPAVIPWSAVVAGKPAPPPPPGRTRRVVSAD